MSFFKGAFLKLGMFPLQRSMNNEIAKATTVLKAILSLRFSFYLLRLPI
jgi:hypothetical protein